EHLEIFRARERPLRHHRDLALHGGVDDEGAPRHPRRILDERADIGVPQIQHILRPGGRRGGGGKRQRERDTKMLHRGFSTRSGMTRPSRSTWIVTLRCPVIWPAMARASPAEVMRRPLTETITSPGARPAARKALPLPW